MSYFSNNTRSEYIVKLREFLGYSSRALTQKFFSDGPVQRGRRSYEDSFIEKLEGLVNAKSARAEEPGTPMGERLEIALTYGAGLASPASRISKALGVSREMARRWLNGSTEITQKRVEEIAKAFELPLQWLLTGQASALPANSPIGLRVGEENLQAREDLFALTQQVRAKRSKGDEAYIMAYLEWSVFNTPAMSRLARHAGGRWHYVQGVAVFVPWVPVVPTESWRKDWSDEVEQIISEELESSETVYAAWDKIRARCLAAGYKENEFPRRVTLHRRVHNEGKRLREQGIDLNDLIQEVSSHYNEQ